MALIQVTETFSVSFRTVSHHIWYNPLLSGIRDGDKTFMCFFPRSFLKVTGTLP